MSLAKPAEHTTGVGSIRTAGSNVEIYSSLHGISQISSGSPDPGEIRQLRVPSPNVVVQHGAVLLMVQQYGLTIHSARAKTFARK